MAERGGFLPLPSDIMVRGVPDRGGLRGGAGLRAAAPPGEQDPARPTVVSVPPPELAVYDVAEPLSAQGTSTGLATGSSAVLAVFQLSANQVAVVNSIFIAAVNLTTAMQIDFFLRINQAPAPGFAPRRIPRQNAAFGVIGWDPSEILYWIPDGARIDIFATVVAGGPVDVEGQFSGWQYPADLRRAHLPSWR